MKKVSLAFFTILSIASCKKNATLKIKEENIEAAKIRDQNIKQGPKILFDKKVYDFGVVNEGDVVKTTFKLTNTGQSDLLISNAKASCGCTVPTWPREVIKAGQSAEVGVVFNTKGKKNKQTKTITLTTNTENGSETVSISGMVTPKKQD